MARFAPTTPFIQRIHAITDEQFRPIPFRSSLLRESRLLSLPPGTEIFHFPGLAFTPYGFRCECGSITRRGFPHSGIPGSKPVSGSPRLIAAYYALHRLRAPRHPPYALSCLTIHYQYTSCPHMQLSKNPAYQRTVCAPGLLAPQALPDLPSRLAALGSTAYGRTRRWEPPGRASCARVTTHRATSAKGLERNLDIAEEPTALKQRNVTADLRK